MDFGWNDDEATFRTRVRDFFSENWSNVDDDSAESASRGRDFEKVLADHG